jgi:hypothetical protein
MCLMAIREWISWPHVMQYMLISPSSSESSSLRSSIVAILARSMIASNSCKDKNLWSKSQLTAKQQV